MSTDAKISWSLLLAANVGIALAAASAAVINHVVDEKIDRLMQRTQHRPMVSGSITPIAAMIFSSLLCCLGLAILFVWVNTLCALLTFISLIGYAFIYTSFLKQVTVQNIVIGGAAGAAPPLLGWVAVTNQIDPGAWLLMLIIFIWTPPHFWALAIHRLDDYAKAQVPMMPNRFGVSYTKLNIVLYTLLLLAVSVLPFAIHVSGLLYLIGALVLGLIFLYYAIRLYYENNNSRWAIKTFRYSITYLMLLFIVMLIDHFF
jgi:protoheme IX farnesyltransferase